MREDCMEYLDKMFPDGWALAYAMQNGEVRFSHYAPTEEVKKFISPFWELAKEIGATESDEEATS